MLGAIVFISFVSAGGVVLWAEASTWHHSEVSIIEGESSDEVLVVVQSVEEEYIVVPMDRVTDAGDCEVRDEECWLVAKGERVTVDVSGGYSFEITSVRGESERVIAEYPESESE